MSNFTDIASRRRRSPESGQAAFFVLLAVSLLLFGAVAFAVDLSNMWFHRQNAQSAADAACLAGAMDLLVGAGGAASGHQGFTPGTAYNCATSSTDSVCEYAALNGYNSSNTTPGNLVQVSFPSSVTGATAPPTGMTANPFMRVDVVDHVQSFFSALVTGSSSQDVRAFSVCGTVLATSPIPILVLRPQDAGTFSVQGTPTVAIIGGPTKSIQVNSGDIAATNIGGNATVDLSLGGPPAPPATSGPGTGSDLGMFGGPLAPPCASPCKNWNDGTTGHWVAPSAPISDPFAQTAAPTAPAVAPAKVSVAYGVDGCPDVNSGCDEYSPGSYASQIRVQSATAIFKPGVYFVTGGLNMDSNSTLRMTNPTLAPGDGSGGVMFYFADTNAVTVNANSGKKSSCTTPGVNSPNKCVDAFQVNSLKCTGTSQIPTIKDSSGNVLTQLDGNVLLGPCSGTYGDPLGAADPIGVQRGIVFFQNRSKNAGTNPNFGGGGTLLIAGTMYFHQCVISGSDVGTGCTSTAYNDTISLGGSSGSSTYVLGDIITDKLSLGGTSGITMNLNPNAAFSILKATLFR